MKLFHLKFLIMLIFMNMFEKNITMEKLYLNQENVNLGKWKSMIYLIIHGLIGRNFNRALRGVPAERVLELHADVPYFGIDLPVTY